MTNPAQEGVMQSRGLAVKVGTAPTITPAHLDALTTGTVRIVVRDGETVDEALKRYAREANEQQGRNL